MYMPLSLVWSLLALLTAGAGLWGIYAAWRGGRRLPGLLGWASLASSLLLWTTAAGSEFGVVYMLAAPAVLVWLFITLQTSHLNDKPVIPARTKPIHWDTALCIKQLGHALVVLVVLLLLSAFAAVLVSQVAPLQDASKTALAIFLMPALWSVLAYWYLASPYKRSLAAGSLCLALASTALALLGLPTT